MPGPPLIQACLTVNDDGALPTRPMKNRATLSGPWIGCRAAATLPPPSDQTVMSSESSASNPSMSPLVQVSTNWRVNRSSSSGERSKRGRRAAMDCRARRAIWRQFASLLSRSCEISA